MTGINATKVIQNLQIVNSFCCANLVARERKHLASDLFPFSLFLLFRFGFLNWVRCKPVGPRRKEGRMGVGVFARLQRTPGIRQWGPRAENWVPICASIWDQNPETGSRSNPAIAIRKWEVSASGRVLINAQIAASLHGAGRPLRRVGTCPLRQLQETPSGCFRISWPRLVRSGRGGQRPDTAAHRCRRTPK